MDRAYRRGIELACKKANLPNSTFPAQCSYSLADALARQCTGEPSDLLS
ncbi:hypothetical protein C8255_19175 [filamentous cyanobacterium CCP3]|nr:hypothetical protein C8255_19175 [filamentous cyanobacterium CCP3]